MTSLDDVQRLVARGLALLALIHIPVLVGLAVLLGRDPMTIPVAAALFAVVPVAMNALGRPPRAVGIALAICLVAQTALLVDLFAGHPWQVEMHFYFFAVLAMVAGFCDVTILVVAAAAIAVHHLLINEFLPSALYPGGTDILRMCMHAAIVLIETGMLIAIARVIHASFDAAAHATEIANAAAQRLARAGTTLEEELASTTRRADVLEAKLRAFRTEIADSVGSLLDASRSLHSTADIFSGAVGATTAQTRAVSVNSEGACERVAEVAANGRSYVDTVADIAERTSRTARMGSEAEDGIQAASAAIDELIVMSNQIEVAAKLITGIANQTSLLALNATIEAARAGEHGRGFSVVAGEVKGLSTEAEKAAREIAEMVATIQGSTRKTEARMASIVATIRALNGETAVIADAVDERVRVAAQMAESVDAAGAVRGVATSIEAIESVAEESAQGAEFLRLAAAEIAEQTALINQNVERFATDLVSASRGDFAADGLAA